VRRNLRWSGIGLVAVAVCVAVIAIERLTRDDDETHETAPACVSGPTTRGIDVSYYQGTIQWKKVRKSGVLYAFIRVSDGTAFPDPVFEQNWKQAARAGVMRGAYQYFRPAANARAQADLLIAALAQDRGELPPVIDVEATEGKSPAYIEQQVRIWVARVREKLGVEPIVYTGPAFWRDAVGGADLTTQPLWIAHYTGGCPEVPAPWQRWTFWQHTDRGHVRGIRGPVDLDLFAGTFADLQAFARRSRLRTQIASPSTAKPSKPASPPTAQPPP
jgi:lysozyme